MVMTTPLWFITGALGLYFSYRIYRRLQLSVAKHPGLAGHAKMSRLAARWLPYFSVPEEDIFSCDGAEEELAEKRREAFFGLAERLGRMTGASCDEAERLEAGVSDLQFTNTYRVPFQFARWVKQHMPSPSFVTSSEGVRLTDTDGNETFDVMGSYGVNVFGYDFYKACMRDAMARVDSLGPVLGPYHPCIVDNVERLQKISGLDEVSFHMSGTEAVMQAVRLARYHTRHPKLVTFSGAYHGWWDGVQPGVGNPRKVDDVLMLRDMDERSLRVLRTRRDIACVLINPLQIMHPNQNAPGDSMLISNGRRASVDRKRYTEWLQKLREVCDQNGVVMIMDEVFLGFRVAFGGAQEYFNVQADMVTYGKTLGGGLPVGVVCGRSNLMRRFRPERPADICFARGTFNSHPLVMAAMNEFLKRLDNESLRAQYATLDEVWGQRASEVNCRLREAGIPISVVNLCSVWTVLYDQPGRYHWMYQFYLRDQGLTLGWIGSGRFIFSHNYDADTFREVADRIVAAGQAMRNDGWWLPADTLTNTDIRIRMARELSQSLMFPRRSTAMCDFDAKAESQRG